ncbi:MAG TPA: 2-C-methyl-D-erythritol 4-phosphate cytidylyltransferase, partial [Vicinamibacterales bacterium]|nr:2-C-methyl-D-erythritol 4-phosphate cytidylyltransferase [Vicinamibacterales bacterium]
MHISAIIAAGGRGQRFGGGHLKQLMTLGGTEILQRSVDAFRRCDLVDDIVVALPEDVAARPPAYLLGGEKRLEIVTGGGRRRDSVAHAFARV